jgi:hypothetical protein
MTAKTLALTTLLLAPLSLYQAESSEAPMQHRFQVLGVMLRAALRRHPSRERWGRRSSGRNRAQMLVAYGVRRDGRR